MPGRGLQTFLSTIFDIAIAKCGSDFADELTALRMERERLLSDSWRRLPPEDFPPTEQQEVFREIDFDTVIIHAARYLDKKDYLAFLYEIAELAVGSGEFDKARRLLDLVVTRHSRTAGKPLLAKAQQKLGDIAFYQNNLQEASKQYRKSLKLYKDLGDVEGMVAIKNSVATVMVEDGKLPKAETLYLEAKDLGRSGNLSSLLVKIGCNLGNLYLMQGLWEKSMDCYKEALNLLGEEVDEARRARIHHNVAIVHKWQKDYRTAMEHLEKSIAYASEANDLYQKGLSYLEKADLLCRLGDYSSATALATTAFQVFSELGDRLSIADVYKIFGMINRENKRFDLALSYFENSLRINEDYQSPLNLGETLYELGLCYEKKGESKKALETLTSANKYFRQINARAKIAAVQEQINALGH